MAKGTKLSDFEKGEIRALKRVRKSQQEISKALGRSKIVICYYFKSPNKYGTRKPTGRTEKLSSLFKRRIVCEVKKKTSSTLKILKSLVDAHCSTKIIWRHLNNEKNRHKKRIHCPRSTMKHKEKQLEYARQYQTMSAREWRNVVSSDEKKFVLNGLDGFQRYWHAQNFPKENYSARHSRRGSLMIWGCFSSSGKQTTIFHWLTKSNRLYGDPKWFISRTRRVLSIWRRMDFSADNAVIHNASITKKSCLNKNIRVLDHPAYYPDLNPMEN